MYTITIIVVVIVSFFIPIILYIYIYIHILVHIYIYIHIITFIIYIYIYVYIYMYIHVDVYGDASKPLHVPSALSPLESRRLTVARWWIPWSSSRTRTSASKRRSPNRVRLLWWFGKTKTDEWITMDHHWPMERHENHDSVVISQMLHGAGIFTYIWVIFGLNVGKYSSTMVRIWVWWSSNKLERLHDNISVSYQLNILFIQISNIFLSPMVQILVPPIEKSQCKRLVWYLEKR